MTRDRSSSPESLSPSVEALIFDCDGTLVDSEPLLLRVMVEEARRLGFPATMSVDVAEFEGRSMAASLAILEGRFGRRFPAGFEPALRIAMAQVFRTELKPVAGALELLGALRLPFCIASNGPREKTELTLGLTGLAPLVGGRIFSAVELGRYKPDPGLFLHAARAMGKSPQHCAVVEDSLAGIEAGLAAGMTVYAYRPQAALPASLAGRVRLLPQLLDLLGEPWHR